MESVFGSIMILVAALVLLLVSAELFTNGIEWLGERLQLSEGVVGSVLAAVGTALPETLIPVVAVFCYGSHEAEEVGLGAIAGAPFMLNTLTMGVCGLSLLVFARMGHRDKVININKVVIGRDLGFFLCAYVIAILSVLAPHSLRIVLALGLVGLYGFYLYKCLAHEGELNEPPEHLHFERLLRVGRHLWVIIGQVLAGLGGILIGAWLFVGNVENLSQALKIPEVILSLIIAPIATELPEKVNSILWVRHGKDTLALGNITGALVFQSCFPVAFGMAFTPWDLGEGVIVTGVVAISCASACLWLVKTERLRAWHMVLGAFIYAATVGWLLLSGVRQ